MTENDRDLNDRTLWGDLKLNSPLLTFTVHARNSGMNENGRSPHDFYSEVSGLFLWLSLLIIIR